jgi:DNA-binding protein HU-beta
MKQSELIIAVANISGIGRLVVKEVLQTTADVVADTLGQPGEEDVAVPGFGKFSPRRRLPRLGRNPATGEEISLPGGRVAKFSPAKRFRDEVAGKR